MSDDHPEPPKPLIERLLNSAAVVALITVVGGGVAGAIITAKMQTKAKEREIATTEYAQYVQARLKVVSDAYDLIGRRIWSSTQLIVITGMEFTTPANPTSDDEKLTAGQKRDIRESFNKTDAEWNASQQRTGLLLGYYHNGAAEVTQKWRAATAAIDAYADCARSWYLGNENRGVDPRHACEVQRKAIDQELDQLTAALDAGRRPPSEPSVR